MSFRINPYLQQPSSDGIYITWFTETDASGDVSISGPGLDTPLTFSTEPTFESLLSYTNAELNQEIDGLEQGSWLLGNENYKHTVDVDGLQPGSTYTYTVTVDGQVFESNFTTAPTADDWDHIRFVAFSDSETEPRGRVNQRDWQQGALDADSLERPTVEGSFWAENLGVSGDRLNYPLTETVGYENNLEIINSRNPDFLVMPGDLIQGGGYQPAWDEFFRHNAGEFDSGLSEYAILPALGNWENFGALNGGYGIDDDGRYGPLFGRQKVDVYFDAPENGTPEHQDNYYRIDYGPVTILTLDSSNGEPDDSRDNYGGEGQPPQISGREFTGPGTDTQANITREQYETEGGTDLSDFNPGSPQWNWVIEQLEDARANGQMIFAQFHHVPYSSGTHGLPMNHEDSSGQGGTPMRQYHPLFEEYGVVAVFSGHSEMFERSFVDEDGDGVGVQYYDVGVAGDGMRGQRTDADDNLLGYNEFSQWTADQDEPELWAEVDGVLQNVAGGKHYGHLEVNVQRLDDEGGAEVTFTPVYSFPMLDSNYELVETERRVYGDEITLEINADGVVNPPVKNKGELVGFAVLDADTFAEGPQSGADNGRVDAVNRIQPIDANGRTGPFNGQPVQGFSAVQFAPGSDGGTYWFLSDNGFGGEFNSSDYLLRLYQVAPSFNGQGGDGNVEVEGFVELRDPNGLIPFDIENEGSEERLLTGSDFDIESFVLDANGDIWVGEEFGPYLLHFDNTGVLLEAPIATPNPVELNTLNGQEPLVIGHRGASGDFPEHTLEAYRAAIAAGADFVEPDVVITKDGVLIARHEPMLDDTTNVAEVFDADRMSTKMLDGQEVTAYFAEDFTLEEIKQLRAVQSRDFRDPSFDGLFEIPTLEEVIKLVQEVEAETGVKVGIYPETKHPTFFDEQGLSLEEPLVQLLQDTGFTDGSRIFIQSFEIANLLDLQGILDDAGLSDVPLVQLFGDTEGSFINEGGGGFSVPYDVIANKDLSDAEKAEIYGDLVDFIDFDNPSYGDLANQEAIDVIGTYASGLGPWKNNIFLREGIDTPVDADGDGNAEITSQLTGEVVPLFEFAHNAGMQIHPYTLRDEERFLTLNPDGTPQTPEQEFGQFIEAGIDGFFTDFPRTGDPVRDKLVSDEVRSPNNPDFDFNTLNGQTPLVIGHRGASGDFPEHTLEAYRLAIYQGADFVEPDLVITSDGVLIARHEPMLDDTTNVAEVFGADRMSTKMIDGQAVTAYFAEEFTLAEIKQLRAVQSRPYRNQEFNGKFEIPTFAEVLALVNEVSEAVGRDIGVYPETKHPTFFDKQGLSLEEPLVQALIANDFTDPNRIFIQSFEISNLLDLRNTLLPEAGLDNLKLVQLFGDTEGSFINDGGGGFSVPYDLVANKDLTDAEKEAIYGDLLPFLDFENPGYDSLANAEAITEISTYADGVGPWKNNILLRESIDTPVDGNGNGVAEIGSQLTGEVVPLIDWAHDAGLQIHPYTLRDEERFLALNEDGTPQTTGDEFRQLIELGVDGFFTDFPETGQIVVEQYETAEDFANLRGSRGYEGMAFSPDRQTLYPMLEGTVFGDPEASLRIYEFDVATSSFEGILGLYQMDDPSHAIGDFTPINEDEFLVIERDGRQGADAAFKKIFKVDLSEIDADGFVTKEEVVDLLNLEDPNDLNGDGETTFSFPFVTIEDVLVLDEETILVANDNNYPFSIGRDVSGGEIDNNEIIQIKLAEPLALDERLGVAGLSGGGDLEDLDFDAGDLPAGTVVTDQFSGLTISADGFGAMLFDTANPTGGDDDLASDILSNVLILSEDGDRTDPDDNAKGGTFEFTFDELVTLESIGIFDIERVGVITVYDATGAILGVIETTTPGNNQMDTVEIGIEGVSRVDVTLVESGAITSLTYLA